MANASQNYLKDSNNLYVPPTLTFNNYEQTPDFDDM
jgi:hypothetical protein